MNPISKQFLSIEQVNNQILNQKPVNNSANTSDLSFEDILKSKQEIKFSKHASMRLSERNISLTAEQNQRLQNGVEAASEKGIKNRLSWLILWHLL